MLHKTEITEASAYSRYIESVLYSCPGAAIQVKLDSEEYVVCIALSHRRPADKQNVLWNNASTCPDIQDRVCKTVTLTFGERPRFFWLRPREVVPSMPHLKTLLSEGVLKLQHEGESTEGLDNFRTVYYHVKGEDIARMRAFAAAVNDWFNRTNEPFLTADYLQYREDCVWFDMIRHPSRIDDHNMRKINGYFYDVQQAMTNEPTVPVPDVPDVPPPRQQ